MQRMRYAENWPSFRSSAPQRQRLGLLFGFEARLFSGGGVSVVKNAVAPEEDESRFHNWFTALVNQSNFNRVFERELWRVSAERFSRCGGVLELGRSLLTLSLTVAIPSAVTPCCTRS